MSVRKRTLESGETRWLVDYRDRSSKRRAKQFRTKREAVDHEIRVGGEIKAGTHVADTASVTVEKAANFWLQRARIEELEASTIKQYGEHVRLHIVPLLGSSTKLSKLSKPAIEQFRDRLLETRSRALARKVMVSLKSLISEAQRRGLTGQNVALGCKVSMQKRHEERISIPEKAEIRALIAKTAELWPANRPWRSLIITALFSGLRCSELRGFAWDHIDFAEKVIRVRVRADFKNKMGSPKSKAGNRDVPASPLVLNTLRQWKAACPPSPQNLVFPTSEGTVITNSNLHRSGWQPLLRAAGLVDAGKPRYRFHDLRHAYASMLIEQNWTPKKVMTVMGHSSIKQTFDLYGHLWKTLEDDADAMAQIEKRLFA